MTTSYKRDGSVSASIAVCRQPQSGPCGLRRTRLPARIGRSVDSHGWWNRGDAPEVWAWCARDGSAQGSAI